MEYIWVGIGGLAGAIARFAMTRYASGRFGDAYPWGTFTINLIGAFLIGLFLTWLNERSIAAPEARLALAVGFLGGYTTFSSYTFEAVAMAQRGNWLGALSYVLGSNVLGLAACVVGIVVARRFIV
jgi:CrcB protein